MSDPPEPPLDPEAGVGNSSPEDEIMEELPQVEASLEADGWHPDPEALRPGSPDLESAAGVESGEAEPEEAEAEAAEPHPVEAGSEEPGRTRPLIQGFLAAHLRRVSQVTARLGLAEAERTHDHLAETALWLALANLDMELGQALEDWLAGHAWDHLFPKAATGGFQPGALQTPALQRLALGLLLLAAARRPGTPASARAMAALASVALGCADPPTGRRLQPACAELGLLPLTEQVPVALPIRQLVLEFRHLDLRQSPSPAFVARIEDLLDRLDRTELLGVRLQDHPAARADSAQAWWTALVGSRSPTLVLLARLTLAEGIQEDAALLEALAERDPSWSLEGASARLESLRATLAERLADTPLGDTPLGAQG